jgi:hypothetical protein
VEEENNTCLTVSRRKSSSGGGGFVGRMITASGQHAKLLLAADVRHRRGHQPRAKKKARIESDARFL